MDDLKYQVDLLTALNERLMNSEKMYRNIVNCTGDLFMFFDYRISPIRVDIIGPWDDVFEERIVNHTYDESYILSLFFEEDHDKFRNKMLNIERNNLERDVIEIRSKNQRYWFSCEAFVSYDSESKPVEKIIHITDITKRKINSEELEYLAYYDSLTGVYNRNYFVKRLRDMCAKAEEEKYSVEVMFIDIDDFKKINDSMGLLVGDELVQELGQYLKEFNSDETVVGRFGSDVFVIAIYNPCGLRSANEINRKINERLRHPFTLSNKNDVKISVTVGVAEYPDAGESALDVMKNAEIVLYRAKENGNDKIQYFEPAVLDKFLDNISLENKLKEAVENENFVLYFQPLYSSTTGKLRGAETLLRWPDENGGFVKGPGEFIPLAEKNGLIVPLGKWVLNEAFRNLSEWRAKYHVPIVLCINVSAIQLEKDNFIEELQRMLQMYNINPEQIELEITEGVLINNFEDVIDKIKTIRGIGMKVSLDDFGSGFSSLSYLKDLPVDTVKIDKSFIDTVNTNDSCSIITESIITLAQRLGYETVAEGVETKEQFNYLRSNNCDIIQGYLLGKPVGKSEFEKILIRQMP